MKTPMIYRMNGNGSFERMLVAYSIVENLVSQPSVARRSDILFGYKKGS